MTDRESIARAQRRVVRLCGRGHRVAAARRGHGRRMVGPMGILRLGHWRCGSCHCDLLEDAAVRGSMGEEEAPADARQMTPGLGVASNPWRRLGFIGDGAFFLALAFGFTFHVP